MIEGARRHGHFDPRWHTEGLRPRHGKVDSLSMIRTGEVDPSIRRWENEGGRYSMTDEPDQEVGSCTEVPPAGLEWYAFLSRYFPSRRRHNHQALKAYEAYRSRAVAPSTFAADRGRHFPRERHQKETLEVLDIQQHLAGGADSFTSWVTTAPPASPLPQSRGNGGSV
jgi:hypothetical protein